MSSSAGSVQHSKGASLFVGNLPPQVTEAKLLEKFSAVGTVCSIRICRDKTTKRFLGYAYVTFRRAEDATRAMETMKEHVIYGRPMSIQWAWRNATQPGDPQPATNGSQDKSVGVFITGLNAAIREGHLRDIFSSSGTIVECGVCLDDAGNSKGFGFLQFDTEEAVENCLERVNSWSLTGSTLALTKLYSNIHVFNFGYRLNFSSLRELFQPYGTIIDYRVVKHAGKTRGFGYVTFQNLKSAATAIGELNGKDLGEGFKMKLESAPRPISTGEGPPNHDEGVNLYIKNMDVSVTNEHLQTLFSPFGPIISVKLLQSPANEGTLAGFVCFASKNDAARAIAEMNGKVVGNGPLSVTLALGKYAKPIPGKPSKSKSNTQNASNQLNALVQSIRAKGLRGSSIPEKTLTADQNRAQADRLYLVVKQLNPSMAGMITAKLLQLDNLQHLMTQPTALKAKVDETIFSLLLDHKQHLRDIQSTPAGSAAA